MVDDITETAIGNPSSSRHGQVEIPGLGKNFRNQPLGPGFFMGTFNMGQFTTWRPAPTTFDLSNFQKIDISDCRDCFS